MAEPLKNMFNTQFMARLAQAVQGEYVAFESGLFVSRVFDDTWEGRELKDRTRHIVNCLHATLPDGYRPALEVLRAAALSPLLADYAYETMIFPDFVEAYGLDDWEASIPAMEQFTQQSSAEFAVRPFILQDQDRMMAQMRAWSQHENHHVRRLSSEGCRPRLPWAMALPAFKQDPAPLLPILETLKHDASDYVRRSVANNFNDIAKDNPQVVLDTLTAWQQDDSDSVRWITGHALRTLVKEGDKTALALLGYGGAQVEVRDLTITPSEIGMGEEIAFSCEVVSTAEHKQSLMIDYVMHFVRANGKSSPKVFKLTKKDLSAGEVLPVTKRHSFKAITTRRYYPGTHAIEIQINGEVYARQEFSLR